MTLRPLSILLTALVLLTACAGANRVTDFTDRSIVYGWIDIGDVDANRLHAVQLYQLRPQTDAPYWNVKVTKFEGGYLYYAFSFPEGAFKLHEVSGQSCLLVFCSNSTFSYSFGKQGSIGAVRVEQPGVYYAGALALGEVKTGWFEAGKFDVQQAENAPSQRQMLEAMLEDANDTDPLITARIRTALQSSS